MQIYETYQGIVTHPLLWIFLGLTLVFYLVQGATRQKEKGWVSPETHIKAVAASLGLAGVPTLIFVVIGLTWLIVATTLLFGLYKLIWDMIWHAVPKGDDEVWPWRFSLAQIAALTTVLGAVIALPLTVNRLLLSRRQTETVEQGHITDRINTAVQGLGAEKAVKRDGDERTEPNLEVRIGAIYALERIAQDSDRDHIQIMEILCAYIRENAPAGDLTPREPPFMTDRLRADIQSALDVIGRRPLKGIELEHQKRYRLDLRNTDLSFGNFVNGNFSAAILVNCILEACNFRSANLSGAFMHHSLLNFSDFFKCNLTAAKLDFVKINRPRAQAGGFTASINMGELKGVSFPGADLSAIQYLGDAEDMNQMMGTEDCILSYQIKDKMPPASVLRKNIYRSLDNLTSGDLADLEKIDKSGFKYWFPFASSDMALEHHRMQFLNELGLSDWPYTG